LVCFQHNHHRSARHSIPSEFNDFHALRLLDLLQSSIVVLNKAWFCHRLEKGFRDLPRNAETSYVSNSTRTISLTLGEF
jgi:hypothetical protein